MIELCTGGHPLFTTGRTHILRSVDAILGAITKVRWENDNIRSFYTLDGAFMIDEILAIEVVVSVLLRDTDFIVIIDDVEHYSLAASRVATIITKNFYKFLGMELDSIPDRELVPTTDRSGMMWVDPCLE